MSMTYEDAYKKMVEAISQIQSQTTPDILYSVVNQTHKQVEQLYSWILTNRFAEEKAQTDAQASNVTDIEVSETVQ